MKNILILLGVLILSSCAYMAHGDTQKISIHTNDSKKVKAIVENDKFKDTYILPINIEVPKSQSNIIVTTIGTECITPTQTIIESKVDEYTFANVFNLGLVFARATVSTILLW